MGKKSKKIIIKKIESVDGKITVKIADCFNDFFLNIVKELTSKSEKLLNVDSMPFTRSKEIMLPLYYS